jgi:hypothetical protein
MRSRGGRLHGGGESDLRDQFLWRAPRLAGGDGGAARQPRRPHQYEFCRGTDRPSLHPPLLQPFGARVAIVEPRDFKTEIISEATRQGPYAAAFEKFLSKRRAFGEKASTAEPVAALVARILNAPEFELRYVAAMPSQRLLLLIKRYAPQRVYEWSLRKILCQYRRGD